MFKKEEEEEGVGSNKFFMYPAEPQHLGQREVGQNTCSLQSSKKSIQELFLKDKAHAYKVCLGVRLKETISPAMGTPLSYLFI